MNRCIKVGEQQTASLMTTKRQVLSRYRALEDTKSMMKELQEALDDLKTNKSPGPDQITNDMIKQLGKNAKAAMLDIFNLSWENGHVPQIWREANMIPIHKKDKDKLKTSSYRPISLTSCVGKVMERLINTRFM